MPFDRTKFRVGNERGFIDGKGKISVKKSTTVLTALLAFFAGLALGLLASPMKNGIGNSGNVINHYYNGKRDDEPEEEDEPDEIPF